jgi:hypothetical protein
VAFDTLLRTLRGRGYDVTCAALRCRSSCHAVRSRKAAPRRRHSYVRNFTDVDDKIIRRATEARAQRRALPAAGGCSAEQLVCAPGACLALRSWACSAAS